MNPASKSYRKIRIDGVGMIKRSFERLGDALGMVIVLIALLVATRNLFHTHDQKLDRKALDKKAASKVNPVNVPLSA